MSLNIVELFGFSPSDKSPLASCHRQEKKCPFIGDICTKQFRDGEKAGVCTVKQVTSNPVICCPNRLYAENYKILHDTAKLAFGNGLELYPGGEVPERGSGKKVAVFGKGWGHELRLPNRGKKGGYFVDWILALINEDGSLAEFIAVEVQTIDTTGTYREERDSYMQDGSFNGTSAAGLNWENVSKRILPQIIYKGHVLRREKLCQKGLFFICPTPVYERIIERLGGKLLEYGLQPGALVFKWYDLAGVPSCANHYKLVEDGMFTTTVDQVANAFTSPSNLPESGVYEKAIRKALAE